jgi:hypothetical protein
VPLPDGTIYLTYGAADRCVRAGLDDDVRECPRDGIDDHARQRSASAVATRNIVADRLKTSLAR